MRHIARLITCLLLVLCVSLPASPFYTPLSDQAIREAYFLGQRHDGTYPSILGKYIKNLPPPKSGPYISSVTFLTPFIQLVEYSDGYIGNYSAQKALHDHRGQEEFVLIFVEIQLTDSYGRLIPPPPNWLSRSPQALVPRPNDFWRDFQVQIYDAGKLLTPLRLSRPLYLQLRTPWSLYHDRRNSRIRFPRRGLRLRFSLYPGYPP